MEMSTFWTAFGSIAAALSAGAIGLAVYQLRFHAWLQAQEVFTRDDFVKAREAVFAHFDDTQQPWPDPRSDDAKKVCRKMDEMAQLLRFVGRNKVLLEWGNPIAKAWLLLEPTVKEERRISHWEEKWRKFKELGEDAVRGSPKLKKLRSEVPPYTVMKPTC